jgi:glucose/arabinose dehydrogenase
MSIRSLFTLVAFVLATAVHAGDTTDAAKKRSANLDAGISLPGGFKAVIVADTLGVARHMAVNKNGDVYVKLSRLKNGKGIVRLRDKNGDGIADEIMSFGDFPGSGIALQGNALFATSDDAIYRFQLNNNEPANTDKPETIVKGLINKRQHASKTITLDRSGNIYVNIGAPSNVCQTQDRQKGSPGRMPCPILDSAGGIWQFKTNETEQTYAQGLRYATGLRNVVGLDWNSEVNDLYGMQHGRDMLFQWYPELFDQKDGAESPAEEMFRLKKGADAGWPYCYYDTKMKQKLLNPEYGGDRSKAGECSSKEQSVFQFPGHLAPNALLFYTGDAFPAKYKNGAFIAFHGSWNRAPEPQEGYYVVFVPFKNGMPSGEWEVFANHFAGENKEPGKAKYRPTGLAQGPDGSLYISDDQKGRIWKVTYSK